MNFLHDGLVIECLDASVPELKALITVFGDLNIILNQFVQKQKKSSRNHCSVWGQKNQLTAEIWKKTLPNFCYKHREKTVTNKSKNPQHHSNNLLYFVSCSSRDSIEEIISRQLHIFRNNHLTYKWIQKN